MATDSFTSKSFPDAVATLFRLNNYDVNGPVKRHGAEIDLIATPLADPFPRAIYIEVTVEYVDNVKYGKDVTKFALIREHDPQASRLIVSSVGFTADVRERAAASRIETLTYAELFERFERFQPYVSHVLGDSTVARELRHLDQVYEEPYFEDRHGRHKATEWLDSWKDEKVDAAPWLILVGEYGTGKTALTKILQRRWTEQYRSNAAALIPFRLELRDFTKQFDANGLLQHFLYHNNLKHIPVDFVFSLVRSGRVVLLLDGYDEMAQYLTARERRACLQALAELSSGGARGLLSSRPNYFSETEEFHVLDTLYANLDHGKLTVPADAVARVQQERELDEFLERHYLDRYERSLRDLDPQQTRELVGRILADDPEGRSTVLSILDRVFRTSDEGATVSLSGKPVIISYLLGVVEQLKRNVGAIGQLQQLTEWDIYTLVLDHLMYRDVEVGEVDPEKRRSFLQQLALVLSAKDSAVLTEDQFRELVARVFRNDRRVRQAHDRAQAIERLFDDLRRSATLDRSTDPSQPGWRFSHNSLREFLVTEYLLHRLAIGAPAGAAVPVTEAMRSFAASRGSEVVQTLVGRLIEQWGTRTSDPGVGRFLALLWDAALRLYGEEGDPAATLLRNLGGSHLGINSVSLERITVSSEAHPVSLRGVNFSDCELTSVTFDFGNLEDSNFSSCILDGTSFAATNLRNAVFSGSLLLDVNFAAADVRGADFCSIDDITIIVDDPETGRPTRRLEREMAVGYLNFNGAKTDPVDAYKVLCNHPRFSVVEKICAKLCEQRLRQRRGLEQRGEAQRDVPFARRFVDYLLHCDLLKTPLGRPDLVEVTATGRQIFIEVSEEGVFPPVIADFLRRN